MAKKYRARPLPVETEDESEDSITVFYDDFAIAIGIYKEHFPLLFQEITDDDSEESVLYRKANALDETCRLLQTLIDSSDGESTAKEFVTNILHRIEMMLTKTGDI